MPSVIHVMMSAMAAAVGVVFNGYILFVFIWNRRIRTANRLLLFHLAFVDIVFSFTILFYNTSLSAIFSVSFESVSYEMVSNSLYIDLEHQKTASRQLCQAQGFLWSLLPMVVVWNVCGLSCDRYAAISIPLHYSRLINAKRASYFVALTWILGIVLSFPPLAGVCPHAFWDARWGCSADCIYSTPYYSLYAYIHAVLAIIVPLMMIIFCNLHMIVISRCHRHRIATAICDMTTNAQVTITHQRSPCHLSKFKGRNAFFTIAQVVGSLAVFTLPYYGVFVWETAKGEQSNAALVSTATFLLTCTPSINAYVYGVKSRMLRQTVKRLLQRHLYKRGTNHDMKRRLSEIFSDQIQRPPISRRLSAPADYCPKTSISNKNGCQLTYSPNQVEDTTRRPPTVKPPFVRSISLPSASLQTENSSDLKKCGDNPEIHVSSVSTSSKFIRPPLEKSESAPEHNDVIECEVHHLPPSGYHRRKELHQKREHFVRSCSYPTESPSYRTKKKIMYRRNIVRQQAIDIEENLENSISYENHTTEPYTEALAHDSTSTIEPIYSDEKCDAL